MHKWNQCSKLFIAHIACSRYPTPCRSGSLRQNTRNCILYASNTTKSEAVRGTDRMLSCVHALSATKSREFRLGLPMSSKHFGSSQVLPYSYLFVDQRIPQITRKCALLKHGANSISSPASLRISVLANPSANALQCSLIGYIAADEHLPRENCKDENE